MERTYSDCVDIINEVENIEQVILTDNTIKCSYYTMELVKLVIQYIKIKNVNVTTNAKKEKE